MKRKNKTITSPEELNENLSYSSPATWITLSTVILLLVGFLVWSFVFKVEVSLSGTANIDSGVVTLHVEESKRDSLKEGQKVFIAGVEGKILSFEDDQPIVSTFALNDGEYDCYIVLKEMKPIEFWFGA